MAQHINTRGSSRASKQAPPPQKPKKAKKGAKSKVVDVKLSGKKKSAAKETKAKAATKSAKSETKIVIEEAPANPFATPSPEMLASFRKAKAEREKRAKQMQRRVPSGAQFLSKLPKNGKKFTIDLRIHSPGTRGFFSTGGVEPGSALVRLARAKSLDLIAVTDFYNAEFVDIVQAAAAKVKLGVIPGFALCCQIQGCREVYFLALFPETYTTADLTSVLEELKIPVERRGDRTFVLEGDLRPIIETVERRGGVIIPSRLDKNPYRQTALPALIENYGFRTFDLVHPENLEYFRERWPDGGFTFFSFSNANALAQVGNRVGKVKLSSADFSGLKEICQRAVETAQ